MPTLPGVPSPLLGEPFSRRGGLAAPVLLLLLCTPLSSARAAEGSSWSTTFIPATLAMYLGDTPARYMVVPAGAETPELTQADQALVVALRTSGKALLVINAQALGPVAQLDDASIARRSARFPVDRVVVLRLFPDASGALTQAVVGLYDKRGESLGSFSAVAGTALASSNEAPPRQAPPSPQPTAPEAPAQPALMAPARPVVPSANPVEQYEQQYIGFDEVVAVSTLNGTVVSQWSVPYEGKYKKPLKGEDFYQKVGREDLMRTYRDKMSLKVVTGIAGGAAILGGGILSFAALSSQKEDCDVSKPGFSACIDRNQQRVGEQLTRSLIGLAISGAGVAVLSVAIALSPHPVTPSEARVLADGYNQRLKADLGLSNEGKPRPSRPPSIQARFTPVVGPDNAGLLLSGTF
jgi:hypothetical protein